MKRFRSLTIALIAMAGLMALMVAGCGSSSSSSDSTAAGSTAAESTSDTGSTVAAGESAADGAASEFVHPGKKNKEVNLIIKAGKEAEPDEREAASKVLEENLEAREAHDWDGQCSSLSAGLVESIEKSASPVEAKAGCAKLVGQLGDKAPPEVLANNMEEPIAALVVRGTQGFAFYHGTGGKDFMIPMIKEGETWTVASLTPEEIPGS